MGLKANRAFESPISQEKAYKRYNRGLYDQYDLPDVVQVDQQENTKNTQDWYETSDTSLTWVFGESGIIKEYSYPHNLQVKYFSIFLDAAGGTRTYTIRLNGTTIHTETVTAATEYELVLSQFNDTILKSDDKLRVDIIFNVGANDTTPTVDLQGYKVLI